MRSFPALVLVAFGGWAAVTAAPVPKDDKGFATIDGVVDGKKVQPEVRMIESGAAAAFKLLGASNLTNYMNPGQMIDIQMWHQEVTGGVEKKRSYLRVRFTQPRQVECKLNGDKIKLSVSEVVFFEPTKDGPVCLWARDGDKFYFANQLAGQADLLKWIGNVQGR